MSKVPVWGQHRNSSRQRRGQLRPPYCGVDLLVELSFSLCFLTSFSSFTVRKIILPSPQKALKFDRAKALWELESIEGQRLFLLSDISTHNRPLRRIKLRGLFPETCQDGIDIRDIRNANKYPGSLREVFGVNHIQLHALSKFPKSTDSSH